MTLKKFYSTTVHKAMQDAKKQLGEDVILIESTAPKNGQPASVTVMVDEKTAKRMEERSSVEAFTPPTYKRSDVRKKEIFTDMDIPETSASKVTPEMMDALKARGKSHGSSSAKSKSNYTKNNDSLPEPKGLDDRSSSRGNNSGDMGRHERSLHREEAKPQQSAYYKDSTTSREVSALHKRFERIEAMLDGALITAHLEYASHPAFQQLLDTGISATTIAKWFKQILNQGIDPYEEQDKFMFELARIVRDQLTLDTPGPAVANMLFVGPSGGGKTSLIMKLATHPDFFGNKKIALVSIEPRHLGQYYSILEPFAKNHNLDYYVAQDGIEVTKLMSKLVNYDHVLFDTPSISLEKKTAFREYWKIRQILASVMPLEVHFVVNATIENYYFREAYATNHPLQPDYVAITHLDETERWGHLIPFLKTLACNVRYISLGASVPDDVSSFSPTWFAEKILSSK